MKNVKSNVEKESLNISWWIVGAFAGVVILWLVNCFWLPCCSTAERRGQFGDKFGAVNALFSGLAFAGLIITLVMQNYELKLQRKEITDQAREMNNQRFENSLFNMLSIHRVIFENLGYLYTENRFASYKKGYDLFSFFYNEVPLKMAGPGRNGIKNLSSISMYKDVEGICVFKSYFCHLYSIFKYIDETSLIDENEKYDYACIVRNQLSDNELLMLYYHAISFNDGDNRFKKLIEKYAIFENISKPIDSHMYAEGAYKHKKED